MAKVHCQFHANECFYGYCYTKQFFIFYDPGSHSMLFTKLKFLMTFHFLWGYLLNFVSIMNFNHYIVVVNRFLYI